MRASFPAAPIRWHDDPHAKWDALQVWCAYFRRKHNREPVLWVDKFCIDAEKMTDSLGSLPVFLAGCNGLLVLESRSLFTRMWCVVELFCFLAMGGSEEDIFVMPIEDDSGPSVPKTPGLAGLAIPGPSVRRSAAHGKPEFSFDVRQARCTVPADQERLFAVIEAYPGGVDAFNAGVAEIVVAGRNRASQSVYYSERGDSQPPSAGFPRDQAGSPDTKNGRGARISFTDRRLLPVSVSRGPSSTGSKGGTPQRARRIIGTEADH